MKLTDAQCEKLSRAIDAALEERLTQPVAAAVLSALPELPEHDRARILAAAREAVRFSVGGNVTSHIVAHIHAAYGE